MDLWLDPTPFGNNSSIPTPTLSTTNGGNLSSFQLLVLPSRGAGLYTFSMDEIRLGDTWASVTPLATAAPGAMFTVTGGGTSCGGPLDVALSGSQSDNNYLLYTNAVYTGASMGGTGSALDFGGQLTPGYYSVLASNINTAAVGWMSNSVTVSVIQPPVVVTNPVPVVTATNNRAAFAAFVTGDTLVYQWYRSGTALTDDSHLSGSTTTAIVITPASTADIGDYYCIITNSCGAIAVTSTNSLTLDAPANLVWYGDAFSQNFWNLATSAEWNSGSAVFNPGDNVTFDDTLNTAAGANNNNLVGVLTPTSIYVNNSVSDYTWIGSGFITGSNSLIKTGTGRLSVNSASANSYSGGTVISNGTVFVQSANALGTGPITLAGGTLETLGKLAFTNDVYLTANTTFQLDQTGNQSITLLGGFNCSPGITMVFTNSATLTNSPNWVVLSSAFTNNAAIVLSVNANATNSTQTLSCNISTNSQIYNGVISDLIFPGPTGTAGGGGLIKQGAGAVYLNGANTYTFLTTNSAGLLAGSGSIKSRLAVAVGATLGAGSATSIGTFTVNSNITLNGNVFIRVNKSLAQSNDLISATGSITNGGTGTLTITNIGGTSVVAGDSFKIFSGAVSNGAAILVTDGGITVWTNKLAIDGTVQALSVVPNYSTNISYSVSGNTLTITWPATHLGWILQSQTNALNVGLKTNNWVNVPGSDSVTSVPVTINRGNPTVFYRLSH